MSSQAGLLSSRISPRLLRCYGGRRPRTAAGSRGGASAAEGGGARGGGSGAAGPAARAGAAAAAASGAAAATATAAAAAAPTDGGGAAAAAIAATFAAAAAAAALVPDLQRRPSRPGVAVGDSKHKLFSDAPATPKPFKGVRKSLSIRLGGSSKGGAAPAQAPKSEQPLAVPPHKAAVATAAHSDGAGASAVAKASLSAAERRLARLARATGGGEADPLPLQPSPAKKCRTL
mmetsp:Transcript_23827/g.75467  ORF Transcript_23827/g.75467 Transcript_23827/m.75467 type:complete len:232 (+) Transcript_23827:3-698(+)